MIPERVTVLATVTEKGLDDEERGEWKLTLEVPDFKSKYPTYCNRVPAKLAAQLKVKSSYQVALVRQNQKKNQDGTLKSGQYYSDYYWGLEGLATPGEQAAPAEKEPGNVGRPDRDGASIEAQTAYKGAAAIIAAGVRAASIGPLEARDLVEVFTLRGMAAIQQAKSSGAAASASSSTPSSVPTPLSPQQPAPAAAPKPEYEYTLAPDDDGPGPFDSEPESQLPPMTVKDFIAEWRSDSSLPQGKEAGPWIAKLTDRPYEPGWSQGLDLRAVLQKARLWTAKEAQG